MLGKFDAVGTDHAAGFVKGHGPGTGGALVQGEDVTHENSSVYSKQMAAIFLPRVPTTRVLPKTTGEPSTLDCRSA